MADPLEAHVTAESSDEAEAEAKNTEVKSEESNSSSNSPARLPTTLNQFAPTQLTIFYNGAVNVYNGVPPEKAQAIMLIAAVAASTAKAPNKIGPTATATTAVAAPSPVLTTSLLLQSFSAAMAGAVPHAQIVLSASSPLCRLQAELPMARRHSLQCFLEKRRNRLASKAPYSPAKPSEGVEVPEKLA